MHLKLYTTQGCHLCESALQLILLAQTQRSISVEEVEIGDDDNLTELYGIKIPVLLFPNGEELCWPFNVEDILSKTEI